MSIKFRTLTVVKHQMEDVWATMRDHMPALSVSLDEIEEIRETSRESTSESVVRVVNEWQARLKLPAGLDKLVSADMLSWTDHAEWDSSRWTCRWRVVPHAFRGELVSQGETRFEPIPAVSATRIEFSGAITVEPGTTLLNQAVVARGVQQTIAALIPRNFQMLCRQLEAHLSSA